MLNWHLTVQTNDGIVGLILGLTEIDHEKDRGKVLIPKIDPKIDQDKVSWTPGKCFPICSARKKGYNFFY